MSKWISVEDKLPEYGGFYLFWSLDEFPMPLGIDDSVIHPPVQLWYYDELAILENVTHWMPLPEPPSEG